MKSTKMILVIALSAAAGAMLPTAAIAKSGYISSQAQRSANKWVLYAEPFRADSASEDIMTQAFLTFLTSGFPIRTPRRNDPGRVPLGGQTRSGL